MTKLAAPKSFPDVDEAAKFLLIGLIVNGAPCSVTLSNDTIFEYWPPREQKKQHTLNLKIYGRNRGLGMRQLAIAENAIDAALAFFGSQTSFTNFGGSGTLYSEWKSHSYGWELPS